MNANNELHTLRSMVSAKSKSVPPDWLKAIDRYLLAEITAGRPLTTVRLRRDQLSHMARCIPCVPAEVTEDDLIAWFGSQAWRTETRRSYRSTARGFFTFLHRMGAIDSNPANDLPTIKPAPPAPRPAPDKAWLIARALADPRTGLMLRLAGEAGLRREEVAKVHTRDLQDGPSLLVHGKGAKERVIPITNEIASAIERGAAGHTPGASRTGWLFPGDTNGHLNPKRVGTLVSQVLPDDWTMHTLRHRFATRAYRATRNLRAVQVLLGHESMVTTQRYLAVDDAEVRAAMLGSVAGWAGQAASGIAAAAVACFVITAAAIGVMVSSTGFDQNEKSCYPTLQGRGIGGTGPSQYVEFWVENPGIRRCA